MKIVNEFTVELFTVAKPLANKDGKEVRNSDGSLMIYSELLLSVERKNVFDMPTGDKDYYYMKAWNKVADRLTEANKVRLLLGNRVKVAATVSSSKWEADGKSGYNTSITVNDFQLV